MNSEMEQDILKVLVTEEELKASWARRCIRSMRAAAPCFWAC